MKKLVFALVLLLFGLDAAEAQWQCPTNNLPLGRGVGTGFNCLPPGTNGNLAVSNGSTWQALDGGRLFRRKNLLYNTSFLFAQRNDMSSGNTTQHFVSDPKYTLDRWWATRFGTAGLVITRVLGSAGLTPVSVPYKVRYQKNTGDASTQVTALCQILPYDVSLGLAGRAVTFSFYATAGADWSNATGGATAGVLVGRLITGTGATGIGGEQSAAGMLDATWNSWTQASTVSYTITTSRTRYQQTVTLGSTVTQIGACFQVNNWNAGASGGSTYVELDSIKLEAGSTATDYEPDTYAEHWPKVAMFYEDMVRKPIDGTRMLSVPAMVFANSAGGGAGTNQNFMGNLHFMPKRHIAWTMSLGVGPVVAFVGPSHVTYVGGTSVYDLVLDLCPSSHSVLDRCLLQFHYVIGTYNGTDHSALTNGLPAAFAIDGSSDASFLKIDAEIN